MFMIATSKQYNGVISSDKFSPDKKKHDINRFLNTGVSPKSEKKREDYSDDTPEKILNSKYMQDLREKYVPEKGLDLDAEYMSRASQKQIKERDIDKETEKLLIIQDEID